MANNDLISLLLQAEIGKDSIENIKGQLSEIEKQAGLIKIKVTMDDTAFKAIENINKAIAKSSQSAMSSINTSQVEAGLQRITDHFRQGEKEASSMTRVTVAGFEKTVELIDKINSKSIKKDVTYDYGKERQEIEKNIKSLQKLEEVTKNQLNLDLSKLQSKFKDIINPQDIENIKNMINSLSLKDTNLGHNIDLVKLKLKELSQSYGDIAQYNTTYAKMSKEWEIIASDINKARQEYKKLEEVTKNNLNLDVSKLSGKFKDIVKPEDIANLQSMINSLKFDDVNVGHNIDLIKLKIKELSASYKQISDESNATKKLQNDLAQLEQVTKKNLHLDVDKIANKFKNLLDPKDTENIRSMINALKFDDPNLGRGIDVIKVKMKEITALGEQIKTLTNMDATAYNKIHEQALAMNKAMDSEALRVKKLGENIGSISGVNFKDDGAMRQYVLSMQDAGAEITKFSRGLNSAGQEQVTMMVRTQSTNNMIKEQRIVADQNTQALYRQGEALRPNVNRMLGWAESMKVAITKSIQWGLSMSALYGSLRKFKDGIQYIKDLEHQTQQIQMVTKMTTAEVNELTKSYSALAQELSTTTLKTTTAAMGFFRQGLNTEEVESRLKSSIQLSAVLGQSLEVTSEQVTAGVNSLGVDAERLGDVVTKIGAVAGTSGQELLKIIQLAGSTAKQGGMSLEELASIGAVISEATRLSADTIGASLNTIIAKFQQVDSLTGEVNEDYGKIIKSIESIGISTVDKTTGQLKNINTILVELGQKWDTLDKKTQNYITTTIGVRQFNRFASLLGNIGRQQELLIEGQNSQNEMTEQYAVYLNKVEAAAERTKNATQMMWSNTINPQFLKQFYDMSTGIVQFIDKVGLLKVAVFTLSTIILLGTKAWREYATSMTLAGIATTIITKMQFLGQVLTAVYGGAITAKMGFTMLAGAFDLVKLKMAAVTLGASLLITGMISYVSKLINSQSELKRANEELVQSYKNNVTGNNENIKRLKNLSSEYDKIKEKIDNQISLNEDEKSTLDELIKINPALVQGYNERGQAIVDTTQDIKSMIEELERANEIENIKLAQGGENFFKTASKDAKKYADDLENVNFKIKNILEGINSDNSMRDSRGGGLKIPSLNALKEEYNSLSEEEKKLASGMELQNKIQDTELKLRDLQGQVKIYESNLKSSQVEVHNSLFAQARLDDSYKNLSSSAKSLVADYIRMMNVMDYKDWMDMQQAVDSFMSAMKNPEFSKLSSEYDNLVKQLKDGTIKAIDFDKEVIVILEKLRALGLIPEDLITKFFKDSSGIENTQKVIKDTTTSIEDLYTSVSTAVDEYDLFKQALKELNEEGQVSKSTLDKLIEIYPNIIQLTGLQKDKMIELINTSKDKRRQMIDDEIASAKATSEATVQRILNVKNEAEALRELANIKLQMRFIDAGNSFDDPAIDSQMQTNVENARKAMAVIEETNRKIQALEGMRTMFDSVDYKYKDKPKKEKDNRQFLETIDAEIRAIKIKNDNLIKTRDLLEDQLKLAKDIEGIEGLNKQYEITGQIIEHNKVMLESFKKEQDLVHARAEQIRGQNKKYDTTAWFDANAEATTSFIQQQNDLIKAINSAKDDSAKKRLESQLNEMNLVFDQIQKLKKAWMESNNEIKNANSSIQELARSQDKLIEQQRELTRQDYIKKQNEAYAEQQKRLQALNDIQEKLVAIIRKRGEEEKKALDDAHNAEMKSLDERHKERTQKYKDETDAFKKMIQDKIDAIDAQYEEEDYLENLNKEREQANELQKQIDVLSLDDSLTARNKTIELRKQLADQNDKIAKMQQKKERDTLKKSLQDQLKDKEQSAKDKEDIANKNYENDKKRLEEDYKVNKEYLDKKYSDEKVYAEAREKILQAQADKTGQVFNDMLSSFNKFEDEFGKGMGILGDIIKDDFIAQLDLAKQAIVDFKDYLPQNKLPQYDNDQQFSDDEIGWKDPRPNNPSTGSGGNNNSSSGKLSSMSKMDYNQYRSSKYAWETYDSMSPQTDDIKRKKKIYSDSNKKLREKYGITSDEYTYDQLKNIPWEKLKDNGFINGGKITETGTLIAPFHGRKSTPEWIFNDSQLKNIMRDVTMSAVKIAMPQIPNVTARQGVTLQIDNFIKADNITKESIPELKKIQVNAMEDLKNLLNKNGVRPSLI